MRSYTTGSGPCHAVVPPGNVRATVRWGGGTGYWAARKRAANSLAVRKVAPTAPPLRTRQAIAYANRFVR